MTEPSVINNVIIRPAAADDFEWVADLMVRAPARMVIVVALESLSMDGLATVLLPLHSVGVRKMVTL